MRTMRRRLFWIAPMAMLALIAFTALGAVLVMLLWNWLTPSLFGWHNITFWQAFGLLALCRILFGGLGWRGIGGSGMSGIRRRMAERCEWMTPEEREQFRQRFRERMRERFGFGPPATENKP